jgi:hypothetical protein
MLHGMQGNHQNSRKAEGFGQIKGGSITPENAGVHLIRYTLGGLPAIEAAAHTQPSSKYEEMHTSHLILYRGRSRADFASTSHAPIGERDLSKIKSWWAAVSISAS